MSGVEVRPLGTTGLSVSALGFGCGAVGGVLVRGSELERTRAVAIALDRGVTYFDTASDYGGGLSETNLGLALRAIRANPVVGTKIRLDKGDLEDIEAAVARRVDAGLRRLGRDGVDLMQLHNAVGARRDLTRGQLSAEDLGRVLATFARLAETGRFRRWGINGLGEPETINSLAGADLHSAQICYNLLNPTAGMPAPPGFSFEDLDLMIDRHAAYGAGVLAFRALAGGALAGGGSPHVNAMDPVETIYSAPDYDTDTRLAARFMALVHEGHVRSLAEAAMRFVLSKPGISSVLIGISDLDQLETAFDAVEKGRLSEDALARIAEIQAGLTNTDPPNGARTAKSPKTGNVAK
jgi:aryl-alcohol dehydrogenase-like predicted oxidoreductase